MAGTAREAPNLNLQSERLLILGVFPWESLRRPSAPVEAWGLELLWSLDLGPWSFVSGCLSERRRLGRPFIQTKVAEKITSS